MKIVSVIALFVFHFTCSDYIHAKDKSAPYEYLSYLTHSLRLESMKLTLELMDERQPNIVIETGTARGGDGDKDFMFLGDGGSSIIFGTWAEVNNKIFYSVDIDSKAINAAKNALNSPDGNIHFVCQDSVQFLQDFDAPIDFLYLDSFDYEFGNPGPSQEHHLKEIIAAYDKLSSHCVVVIDDCSLPEGGKGGLAIPFLVDRGWEIIYDGYQVVLVRSESM